MVQDKQQCFALISLIAPTVFIRHNVRHMRQNLGGIKTKLFVEAIQMREWQAKYTIVGMRLLLIVPDCSISLLTTDEV